ncbi:MAG TPA: DUF455 family protein [Thermoanaerobaculia bacterium]|nr:DUF455 family protein [Thermoanaerobaculia bacterium]
MEIRDFALTVVRTEDLDVKLAPAAEELTDESPGPALRIEEPGRPPSLRFARRIEVPSIEGMPDPKQRPRILHALANHELQAAELFAWALLAFPDAPSGFRRGLLKILDDEQRHTRMYLARLEASGAHFGQWPVNGYFWSKVADITTPLRFLCAMSLTFENANLDHTEEYAEAALKAGDPKSAAVIEQVQKDEIEHVRFGWEWLQVFKREDESAWDAYRANLTWPLRPVKAKGLRIFNREGRAAAGLDEEFIRRLEESEP